MKFDIEVGSLLYQLLVQCGASFDRKYSCDTVGQYTSDELYNICDRVHAECNYECPVYVKRDVSCKPLKDCPFHKDGEGMKAFLES